MLDLGFALLLVLWSRGVGLWVLRRLHSAPEHPIDAWSLSVPLGLGVLALATFGLAECGGLTVAGIGVVLGVGVMLGGSAIRSAMIPALRSLRTITPRPSLVDAFLAATLLGTLLTALAPVTDGDALCYHLQVPKVFLERHAALFDPDLHETVYPLVTEMLYAVALALRGPIACRLVQWIFGVVFAANVTALARPVLGARARWAGTIALLVPAISNGMGAPLNDVALAACGNAAVVAWTRWRQRPTQGNAVLVGLLTGLALGVKYPALVLGGLLGLAMTVESFYLNFFKSEISNIGSAGKRTIAHAALVGTVASVVGGCWYLRAFIHTGNPVYPFFRHTFGGSGIDDVLDPVKRPLAVNLGNLLTALGPLTLQPDRFDSFSHQLGPAFLLFLPALVLFRAPRRIWGLVGLALAFLMLCLTQRQSMRFVLIAVGPLAVAVAWLAGQWWDRRTFASRALLGMVVLMLGFETALAVARARHGFGVILGRESAEAYLMRKEPTFRMGRWISGHLPRSARLIGQDHRGFYFPCPYTMELAHRRRTGLGTRGETAEAIIDQLRQEGFTHLLMCPPVPESVVEFDPTLSQRLAPWLASRRPLYQETIADADGVAREYALYDLAAESHQTAHLPAQRPSLLASPLMGEGLGGGARDQRRRPRPRSPHPLPRAARGGHPSDGLGSSWPGKLVQSHPGGHR
jgi:hypothetical protein